MLARIGELENSLKQILVAVSARPDPTMVVQKKPRRHPSRKASPGSAHGIHGGSFTTSETSDANGAHPALLSNGANTASADGSARELHDLERREMREVQDQSAFASISSPFEA